MTPTGKYVRGAVAIGLVGGGAYLGVQKGADDFEKRPTDSEMTAASADAAKASKAEQAAAEGLDDVRAGIRLSMGQRCLSVVNDHQFDSPEDFLDDIESFECATKEGGAKARGEVFDMYSAANDAFNVASLKSSGADDNLSDLQEAHSRTLSELSTGNGIGGAFLGMTATLAAMGGWEVAKRAAVGALS
ncbi:hypothetical protein KBC31_00240 [Candidatus Saccharibacteria bacterium]|nr:hypothetical protein [Candidatus Saccharibacteria bacterium]